MTIEAACYAISGATFRGTPPKDEGATQVELETWDGLVISRKEAKFKSLDWSYNGASPDADTTAKSKDALLALTGPPENWKRTHVFSAADLLAFSGSTDMERKLLLEELVGLGRFDEGYKRARAEFSELDRKVKALKLDLQRKQTWLEDAEREAAAVAPPPALPLDELQAKLSEATKLSLTAQQEQTIARRALDIAQAKYTQALSVKGNCPTCGKPMNDPAHLAQMIQVAQDEVQEAKATFDRVRAETQPLMDDYLRANTAFNSAQAESRANERLRVAHEAALKRVDQLVSEIFELEIEINSLEWDCACLDHATKVIQAVRGKIFTEALDSLADLSNRYLDHLLPGMRLSLEVAKVRAANEAISLQCDRGDGRMRPYEALSGGQRRRVDIALLLSLSQLSPSAGTLYFDEAFDTLDKQGIEAVCELLTDFGQERCVVVISHNEDLASRLPVVRTLGPT
jgi:DNA repair exonuclease SbcCD ATPase subunit